MYQVFWTEAFHGQYFRLGSDGTEEYVSKNKSVVFKTTSKIPHQMTEFSSSGEIETVFDQGDKLPEGQERVHGGKISKGLKMDSLKSKVCWEH